jgi:putative ABC transport system ATP-binding protein
MITLKGIEKVYNSGDGTPTTALTGINIHIGAGEFVAIMGPSGSGKSTLMHILGFLDKPSGGTYEFDGEVITYENDDALADLRNQKLGFVFQAFNLLPRTTVIDNIRLPLQYARVGAHRVSERHIKEVLESVGMGHRMQHLSNQLSGGEQQRVAIARALINDPKVIFADEPTGNLDSKSGQQIIEILQKLNDQGRTIILVTHETFAAEAAKRILQLKDGRLVGDEPVKHRRIASRDGYEK